MNIINLNRKYTSSSENNIAVALHLYYPDLIYSILKYLENFPSNFDLYISTPHHSFVSILEQINFSKCNFYVLITENSGRDVGPFIKLFRAGIFRKYKCVLKIHGKKSLYSPNGDQWRDDLLSQLAGSYKITSESINLFDNSKIGIIGPHNSYLTNSKYWGSNFEGVSNILKFIAPSHANNPTLGFFAGTMFWFKPTAFNLLHSLPESMLNFGIENGKQDGTLAHCFERLFCNIVRTSGYICSSLALEGKEINDVPNENNFVPVLK